MNMNTDPYGKLEYAVGSADDFVCFDYAICRSRQLVRLHAVLNSETGHFIQDFCEPVVVSYADRVGDAYDAAMELVGLALEWCAENDVEHDQDGWNQDPAYFARAVHAGITGDWPAIRVAAKMEWRPLTPRAYLNYPL